MSGSVSPIVAVVLKGYPRLSETFIAQELRALEQRGLTLRIFSLRHPSDTQTHPIHREIQAPVDYLPEYLGEAPRSVFRAWRRARGLPGYRRAVRAWLRDLRRDPSRNRIRRFGQACVLAARLPSSTTRLYAHFLHTPASVARYAAALTGLPWCCSAHAKDIWTTPEWEKREKLRDMDWLVTCTAAARDHLSSLVPAQDPGQDKVSLVYHGLDLARFAPSTRARPDRDGSRAEDPVRILSVGRLVEKKGYDDLLDALARLGPELHWRLIHVGGGALAGQLQGLARQRGLADRIDWRGPQAQGAVLDAYAAADVFVLASRVADDGDRDGLPNVLMEAQSQSLACITTSISGIPELVLDERTGILVPPGDPAALAANLAALIADPGRRHSLGEAGNQRVRSCFDMTGGIDILAKRFALPMAAEAAE